MSEVAVVVVEPRFDGGQLLVDLGIAQPGQNQDGSQMDKIL